MRRWTLVLAAAILLIPATFAVNQCSLGHKVYSVETGNTVCAPLAPFQCVHSCEWNTSCANTAHSRAFNGRRTFVAGMILTTDNFLVLCCATFANVVQQNQKLENRCVWVPPTNTVENGPSVRFDPPLNANEYIRDVHMKRLERGRVEVRAQICKFITQRTNCDEATMPDQDKQLYSLLQLRLSRAEAFLKEHNGTALLAPVTNVPDSDQFRDEVAATSPSQLRGLAGGLRSNGQASSAPRSQVQQQIRADLPLRQFTPNGGPNSIVPGFRQVIRPRGRDESEVMNFDSPVDPPPFAHRIDQLPRQVQPIRAAMFGPDGTPIPTSAPTQLLNGGSGLNGVWARRVRPTIPQVLTLAANRRAALSSRSLHHRHEHLMMPDDEANEHRQFGTSGGQQVHTLPTLRSAAAGSSTFVHSGERESAASVARATATAFGDRFVTLNPTPDHFFALSGSPPSNPGPRYILATNQTKELVPKFRRTFARGWRTPPSGFPSSDAANRLAALRRSLAKTAALQARTDEEIDERPMKSPLTIRKLRLGDTTTSFGGSFAPSALAPPPFHSAELTPVAPTARGFRQDAAEGKSNALSTLEFAHQAPTTQGNDGGFRSTHGVVFSPAQRTLHHSVADDGADRLTFQNGARPPFPIATIPVQSISALSSRLPTGNAVTSGENGEQLHRLLDCCQQQAPGCRHLCSPDVSKEEIKRAIQTNQCPPLSMTSVLQCFPRFYDISSVGRCCELATTQTSAPSNSFLLASNSPPRLPGQCQSLCASNFKLSFSHFACVDHISTIVDCYRDLLQR